MAQITSTSKHSRTRMGSTDQHGNVLGKTTLGHAQYTIAYKEGSKTHSMTMHCSETQAKAEVDRLTKIGA